MSASNTAISEAIFCPPLLCRSDNGVVIVVEEQLPLVMALNHSDYEVHVFTNLSPNENGCLNLDIALSKAPIPGLVANVYYYVKDVGELENKVVCQSFPAYYLNKKRFRIGFKAFYATDQSVCTLDILPIVWVSFTIELQKKEAG